MRSEPLVGRSYALLTVSRFALRYVKEITAACGYKVEVEPMRIPSTRNVSVVGRVRTIDIADPAAVEQIAANQTALLKKAKFSSFQPRARDQKSHDAKCACSEASESHEETGEPTDAVEEATEVSLEPSAKRIKID